MLLTLLAVIGSLGATEAKFEWPRPSPPELALSVRVLNSPIRVGEPVFVKVGARNDGQQPVDLFMTRWFVGVRWQLHIRAPDEERWHEVGMRPGLRTAPAPLHSLTLEPGESLVKTLTLWFQEEEDHRSGEPYPLVFPKPGRYSYRLSGVFGFRNPVAGWYPQGEGRIVVHPGEAGLEEVRQFVGTEMPTLRLVDAENKAGLEKLLRNIGESPYTPYVKWLLARAFIAGDFNTAEGEGEEGARRVAYLHQLSEELLEKFAGTGTPPEREALLLGVVVGSLCAHDLELWIEGGTEALREAGWEPGGALPRLRAQLRTMGFQGGLEELTEREARRLQLQQEEKARRAMSEVNRRFAPTSGVRSVYAEWGRWLEK